MIVRRNGQPHQFYTRDPNASFMNASGKDACRFPSGHPEAFFEAFANIYAATFDAIVDVDEGQRSNVAIRFTPTFTTALKACSSFSSASPVANKTARGCP